VDRSRFIESPLGKRRVLQRLAPDQYAIGRIDMPLGVKIACKANNSPGGFLTGRDFYLVLTGPDLDPYLVEMVVQRARIETAGIKGKDDLSDTGPFKPVDPHYDAFRLTHALEHLVASDIFSRQANDIPPKPGRVWGGTTIYGFKMPMCARSLNMGFHMDPRLATPEQVRLSVANVLHKSTRS
jgi:hypothetical protein